MPAGVRQIIFSQLFLFLSWVSRRQNSLLLLGRVNKFLIIPIIIIVICNLPYSKKLIDNSNLNYYFQVSRGECAQLQEAVEEVQPFC